MAGMTTPGTVTLSDKNPHGEISWVEIHADGTETNHHGHIWSPSAPVSGVGKAFWVLEATNASQALPDVSRAVLVAVASHRHRCGRASRTAPRPLWNAVGGRYVDKGETYRQPDPRSKFGIREAQARLAPPKRIRLKPMHASARTEYETFLRTVADLTPDRTRTEQADRTRTGRTT